MQVITNSVRSRSPSSRFSSGTGSPMRAFHFGAQLDPNSPEALTEKFRLAAEPDPDVAFQAKMRAGDDEDALIHPNALAQGIARCIRRVLHQAQRTGFGLAKCEKPAETRYPFAHHRQILLENATGARI